MTTCRCGLAVGDCVTIYGWDGQSDKGCWTPGMKQYVGTSDAIRKIEHNPRGRYCAVNLSQNGYVWQHEWLSKADDYTLF